MQFTDLLLGVLTEFPESLDGCHSDRQGEPRPITKHDTEQSAEGVGGRRRHGSLLSKAPPLSRNHTSLHPRHCSDSEHGPSRSYKSHPTVYSN